MCLPTVRALSSLARFPEGFAAVDLLPSALMSLGRRSTAARAMALALVVLWLASVPIDAQMPLEWSDVPRIVAIGDVHGSLDKLLPLLRGTRLIDDNDVWSGGQDHLVFVGDLIDRGPNDRAVLDLARRLQQEAQAAGGRVHVLLGNHEVMNMSGDLRYVSKESYRAWLDEEIRKDRTTALQKFRMTVVGPTVPLAQVRPAFDEAFPPGYFARLRAFWFGGEYGDWLREQPAILKINDVVFVHGGLTESIAALGLAEINRQVRESIVGFMQNAERLVELSGAPPSYGDAVRAARSLEERTGQRGEKPVLAQAVLQYSESIPYVASGPLWYRGVSVENERIERLRVERSLSDLAARAMVVGHTPTGTGRITSRFNSTVFRIDVGMAYGREPLALVLEENNARVFDPRSNGYEPVMAEPPQGEKWSRFDEHLPDTQLERFLLNAPVVNCSMIQRGIRYAEVCELDVDDLNLRAVFQSVDEQPGQVAEPPQSVPRSWRNEVAAYKLDRMLQLGMVPVTVERTVDGRPGSLQVWLESAVDLAILETYGRLDLLDNVEQDVIVAKAFTAFLDVYERARAGKMLLPHEGRVAIADSTKGFSKSPELQMDLMPEPCGPMRADREALLRSLTPEGLERELGRWLDSEQISALLARRDRILELCTSSPARPSTAD